MQKVTSGRRPYTFDRVVRLFLSALTAVIVITFIYVLRNVLLPFGVAMVLAYLLEPIVQFNRRLLHLGGRTIAVMVTLFGLIFGLGVAVWFMAPSVSAQMAQLGALISVYVSSNESVPLMPDWLNTFLKENIKWDDVKALLSGIDWMGISARVTSLLSSGIDMLLSVLNWLLSLLYLVFIMLDYDRLWRGLRAAVPPTYRRSVFAVANDLKDAMNHYFRGQAVVAMCVGVLFAIGFTIMGLPLAIILGLFIGLLNMVPYLQLVSIPVTGLLCLVYSAQSPVGFWPLAGEAFVVYIVVQAIQDLVLTPKIMGKAMGLNPAIILLSLSIWGTLLGLLGMIIALPMTTLLISYYERFIIKGESRRRAVRDAIEVPLRD